MAFGVGGPDLYGLQRQQQQRAQQTAQQMMQPGYNRLSFPQQAPQAPAGSNGDTGSPAVSVASGGGLIDTGAQVGEILQNDTHPPAAPGYQPDPSDWRTDTPGPYESLMHFAGGILFNPSAVENWNQQYGSQFMAPDANQQLWDQQQAQGPMLNNSQTEYDAFGARRPNIASEPGYGTYYDNAETNLRNSMNTELAARGAYGSSVGLGQMGKTIGDLRADQARTEADYNLKRLAEQRQWNELGGTLARNADLSGQGNLDSLGRLADNASDSRLKGLEDSADVANAASTQHLSRILGGYGAYKDLQTVRDKRIRDNLGNINDEANTVGSIYSAIMNALQTGDWSLLDSQLGGYVGEASQGLSNAGSANFLGGASNLVNLGTQLKSLFSSGKDDE